MAKKVQNLQKLQTEIALQEHKLKSLKLLDEELSLKIERLQKQRKDLQAKASRLNYAMKNNQQRLQSHR